MDGSFLHFERLRCLDYAERPRQEQARDYWVPGATPRFSIALAADPKFSFLTARLATSHFTSLHFTLCQYLSGCELAFYDHA